MTDLVGRAAELAELVRAVERPGPGVVTLVGAPGMGKTTVVRALLDRLEAPLVLTAQPVESELPLAFSGLMDLFAGVPPSAYEDLPVPQRSALRAALLLEEAAGGADPRAVGAAVRGVLALLAEQRPVVLVVDDAQWLDSASCGALGRALQRMGAASVVLVCAARPTSSALAWLPTIGVQGRTEVRLGPLSADDILRIVQDQLGAAPAREDLRGVERASGGNPLHALELVRHQFTSGVGVTVEELVQQRINVLPRETRIALLTAALASDPRLEVLARSRSCSAVELVGVLDPALRAGLVAVGDAVLFAHPLYAEAARSAGSAPDCAEAHRRLSEAEPSEEARARHAGLSSDGPDARLASDIASVAVRTRARGAWDAAADLLALSVQRTPIDSPDRGDRAVLLGQWGLTGGEPTVAERWFRDVRTHHPNSIAYWAATMGLARLCLLAARREEVHALNRELLTARLDPVLAAEAMIRTTHDELSGRPDEQLEAIVAANRILTDAGPVIAPSLLLAGLSLEIQVRMVMGEPTATLFARAIEFDEKDPSAVALDGPALQIAHAAMMADRFEEGRLLCHSLLQRCRDTGDDVSLPTIYSHLGHLEQRAGRWDAARASLLEGERWAQGQGQLTLWQLRSQRALLDGLRGDRAPALEVLRQAEDVFVEAEFLQFSAIVSLLAGRIHAAYGEHIEAFATFGRAIELAAQVGWDDPANFEADVPFVEAALALDQLEQAKRHLDRTQARAHELGQDNALAVCLRGRVGLAAARGDLEEAARLVPQLLAAYEAAPGQPLDRALALLVAGRVHRRTRQKRLAHNCLASALAIAEELGCVPYADQARAELRRVGLRPNRSEVLTPTESEVARLAADGLRNAEIAATAHLSLKTVEAVLSRSYRKLGIRSRAQLARALADMPAKSTSP